MNPFPAEIAVDGRCLVTGWTADVSLTRKRRIVKD